MYRGAGNLAEDRVEKRVEVFTLPVKRVLRDAQLPDRIQEGKLELFLGDAQVDEQVVDLVQHLGGARIGPIDLVDDDDDGQPSGERLAEHEAGLRQGTFGGIDEQDGAIHHRKGPLHLAAEIGVPRRIQDVDLHTLPDDGTVLRRDGDSPLALEVHAVHEPFLGFLSFPEYPGLLEHRIDEGGLAVVDMRDDRDVADERVRCVFVGQRRSYYPRLPIASARRRMHGHGIASDDRAHDRLRRQHGHHAPAGFRDAPTVSSRPPSQEPALLHQVRYARVVGDHRARWQLCQRGSIRALSAPLVQSLGMEDAIQVVGWKRRCINERGIRFGPDRRKRRYRSCRHSAHGR